MKLKPSLKPVLVSCEDIFVRRTVFCKTFISGFSRGLVQTVKTLLANRIVNIEIHTHSISSLDETHVQNGFKLCDNLALHFVSGFLATDDPQRINLKKILAILANDLAQRK